MNEEMNEFIDIVTLNFYIIFPNKVLSPFYRGRKGGPERLCQSCQVTDAGFDSCQ